MTPIRSLRCPTCRKIVMRGEPDYPFCSERCRLIDLGKWASGAYVISTPINEADQFGEAAESPPRADFARREVSEDYTVNPGQSCPEPKPDGQSRNRS